MVSSEVVDSTWSGRLLGQALAGNGLFSLASGAVLAAAASYLSQIMGAGPPAVVRIIGIVLVPYGAVLIWTASQRPISRTLAVTAVLLDVGWVLGSALLLLTPFVPFTVTGKWIVAILADLVAVFAIAQYIGLRRYFAVNSS